MTCSFAMRGSRKSLFDAGLNRSTRLESSQLTDVGGSGGASPDTPHRSHTRPETSDWRRQSRRSNLRSSSPLVYFLRAAGGARGGGRGLGAAVAVGAVVGEGQRGLELELRLEAGAALLPALLIFQLVLVQRRRL